VSVCRCGHEKHDHGYAGGACCRLSPVTTDVNGLSVQHACQCERFDDGALPEPGERPVFGVHRLPSAEAAWATEPESVRERRFREWVKGAPGDMA
jgi:hypothetical protein